MYALLLAIGSNEMGSWDKLNQLNVADSIQERVKDSFSALVDEHIEQLEQFKSEQLKKNLIVDERLEALKKFNVEIANSIQSRIVAQQDACNKLQSDIFSIQKHLSDIETKIKRTELVLNTNIAEKQASILEKIENVLNIIDKMKLEQAQFKLEQSQQNESNNKALKYIVGAILAVLVFTIIK